MLEFPRKEERKNVKKKWKEGEGGRKGRGKRQGGKVKEIERGSVLGKKKKVRTKK